MKTTETMTEQQADEEAVNEHVLAGKPLDPEVYRRVRGVALGITRLVALRPMKKVSEAASICPQEVPAIISGEYNNRDEQHL
jgi:hypothetical protein